MRRLFAGQLQRNIGFNVGLQGAMYIIPLLSVPHLLHHLGPHQFGIVAFAQALTQYLCVLVDYGHPLTVTRQIALGRTDPARVAHAFWTTIVARMLLGCVAFAIFVVCLQLLPHDGDETRVYWCVFPTVIGSVVFPSWLFQGLERFRTLMSIQIATRGLALIGILWLVQTPADDLIAASLLGFQGFFAGAVSFLVALRFVNGPRGAVSWGRLQASFRDGFHFFFMSAAVTLYTSGSPFIVGLVSSAENVAYFSLCERVIRPVLVLIAGVAPAAYAYIARLARSSHADAHSLVVRLVATTAAMASVVSIAIMASAQVIVSILGGNAFLPACTPLRLMAIVPTLVAVSNVLGISGLCAMGSGSAVSRVLTPIALISGPWIGFLSYRFGATGAAVGVLSTEFCVTLLLVKAYYSRKTTDPSEPELDEPASNGRDGSDVVFVTSN
ncbi:MAG TPA: oligosaccharide flippase family protein [Pirellulales bacterium]|nr:oligosaccharide flippase family protein [Pirellulales bacterium]